MWTMGVFRLVAHYQVLYVFRAVVSLRKGGLVCGYMYQEKMKKLISGY